MITLDEMRRLEDEAERKGIPKTELMENAGRAVAELIEKRIDLKSKRVLVVCYHGNNGGDGFVAARYLMKKFDVAVAFIGKKEKLTKESLPNFRKLPDRIFVDFDSISLDDFGVIVDAILGTGAQGKLREPILSALHQINSSKAYVVSVDIPTGLDPDTGKYSDSDVVDADLIVTFHDIKAGLVRAGLEQRCVIADIGIPVR